MLIFPESKYHHRSGKSYIYYEEKELKRTKRHLDLEPRKISPRIEVSPIKHTERNKRSLYRPYVPGQGNHSGYSFVLNSISLPFFLLPCFFIAIYYHVGFSIQKLSLIVQDVRIQIKLKTYWKDQLANRYTPQFRLLAGNVIDEVSIDCHVSISLVSRLLKLLYITIPCNIIFPTRVSCRFRDRL